MKKRVIFLKAPADIKRINVYLTPGKLYRTSEPYGNFGDKVFYMRNDAKSDFFLQETDVELYGWEPIYNTDIAVGVTALIIAAGLGLWILSLMS